MIIVEKMQDMKRTIMNKFFVFFALSCLVTIGEALPHFWGYSHPFSNIYSTQGWGYRPYFNYQAQKSAYNSMEQSTETKAIVKESKNLKTGISEKNFDRMAC